MSGAARQIAEVARPELAFHRLRAALARFGALPDALEPAQRQAVERQAAREFAVESRVLAAPEAGDVAMPPASVEQAMDTVRARYADAAELDEDLRRNGLSEDSLREALVRELTVEAVLERVKSRVAKVDDVEVMIYYHLHQQRFMQPETRTARHVLVTVNDEFPENRRREARARIDDIAGRVRRKPSRFAEQAAKHSECPTAMRGGLLGRVPRGRLYPELDAVLFQLEEGGVSEVLESPLGFHVLLCEVVHAAGPVALNDARPWILEKLQERRARMCVRNWLAALPAREEAE